MKSPYEPQKTKRILPKLRKVNPKNPYDAGYGGTSPNTNYMPRVPKKD